MPTAPSTPTYTAVTEQRTPPGPPPLWEQYRARLDAYRAAKVNYDYDPARVHEYTAATGWRLDDYAADLPSEAPGPPVPGGTWERARVVLTAYQFPPPDLLTGIFPPDQPLADRVMLLRAQFLGFSFWFGVRVSGVIDEERTPDKASAPAAERVWGYSYHTLAGHFEKGEITFSVHKTLATGKVTVRIHAYSQPDRIANPFYRLGFRLFGRMLQRRFARESLRRIQQQVAARAAG